ncbi:MAG: FecR domain-containing protein [Bryobacteraceae bacterium]
MPDEYLWDRSGEPDSEIAKLEKLLARYRYSARAKRFILRPAALLAIAAGVVLIASVIFWLVRRPASDWRMAGKPVGVGQTVETRNESAKLESQFVGELRLDPNSRLQVRASRGGTQQLALQRGTMHALIWAPPSRFVVDTPSARTIDLGCSYTLSVLDDDSGMLTVQTGWVAFQAGSIESFIPAGAACRTRPHFGPGLPYFEDATSTFREAVAKFDASGGREGLEAIVANARKRDALTLWHLVIRTSGTDRSLAVKRFARLVPGVNTSGLDSGIGTAIDQAWDLLGLGATDWWRTWKHDWPRQP